MSSENCDVIVMGCGGFGSAAMYHLARQGLKVIGIDRFHPPHDRGSSHGETRIIRKAYFEHPNYVPLLHRAWDLWEELARESDHRLIERRDLLMSGPPGSEVTEGARQSARLHYLPLEDLTRDEACRRYPMFNLPQDHAVTLESTAGFLRVERCVSAHLELAQARGAQLRCDETVQRISGSPGQLSVQTDRGTYSAGAGVLTCGAWTSQLLPDYAGLITVRRKTLFWFPIQSAAWADSAGAPMFFLDLPEGQFYGLPSIDGRTIKTGEHTGGETVADPSTLERSVLPADERPVSSFVSERLIDIESKPCRSAVCMYSMSPDGHFLFDQHADLPLVVGAGFSGHGFKFASVLGEAAAELIQHSRTSLDIDFLSIARFAGNADRP
jgi:sarcosine oxidase